MSYTLYNPDQDNYPYNPWDGTQKQRKNISYTDHTDLTSPVIRSDPKFIPVYVMPWNADYVPVRGNTPIQKIIQIKNSTK